MGSSSSKRTKEPKLSKKEKKAAKLEAERLARAERLQKASKQPSSSSSSNDAFSNGTSHKGFDPSNARSNGFAPGLVPEPAQKVDDDKGEKLIITYDIGTTYSGCAYMYRNAVGEIVFGPDIIDQWPGSSLDFGKTPSVLLYQDGKCLNAWGAQADTPQYNPARLRQQGIQRVEWFKLHISPGTVPPQHLSGSSKAIPHGLTPFDVFGDYLTRLHAAALDRIRAKRGESFVTQLVAKDRVTYILTIPVAWKEQHILKNLRKCALKAGLISQENSGNLDFCCEPEASALHCYSDLGNVQFRVNDLFTVLDGGGGTVDFTTYKIEALTPDLRLKEVNVGAPRCVFRGATFVDTSFENNLDQFLRDNYPHQYQPRHLVEGIKQFKASTKLQFSLERREETFLQIGREDELDQGCIELSWEWVESAFKPHVDVIVSAAHENIQTPEGPSRVIVLTGGFGSSDYLRQRLGFELHNIMLLQPDDKASGAKAVALGGCRYVAYRSVASRMSPRYYGISIFRPIRPSDHDNHLIMQRKTTSRMGQPIVRGVFATLLAWGESVGDDEWRKHKYSMEVAGYDDRSTGYSLALYETRGQEEPLFCDDFYVRNIGDVRFKIPPTAKGKEMRDSAGVVYTTFSIEVWFSLGRAEVRAQCFVEGQLSGEAKVLES